MKSLGRHLLTEFYGCDRETLNDPDRIKKIMEEAAITSGASIVQSVFHLFIFTCGEEVDPWRACHYLKEKLRAGSTSTVEIFRGAIDSDGKGLRHKPLGPEERDYSPELSPSIHKFDDERIHSGLGAALGHERSGRME